MHLPRMRKHQVGFSLVEIMVGMVIGMFAIIVMLQSFSFFEERKRTASGGSDAMSEGVMALYALQRDIRQAGYGVSALEVLGCPLIVSGVSMALAPVTINPAAAIIPAGDDNTDTLLVITAIPKVSRKGAPTLPRCRCRWLPTTTSNWAVRARCFPRPTPRRPCRLQERSTTSVRRREFWPTRSVRAI